MRWSPTTPAPTAERASSKPGHPLILRRVDEGCILCQIVRGEAPASIVYEDDTVIAFLDNVPISPGHVLVIPRRHAASLAELDPDDGRQVFHVAQKVTAVLRRSGLRCDAANLLLNDGVEAGQRVFHIHMHVIPRYAGQSLRSHGRGFAPPDQLAEQAERIRRALGQG